MTRRLDDIRFSYVYGHPTPSVELAPGETVVVACPDSDNFCADGTPLPPERLVGPTVGAGVASPAFAGNPVAGPIAVVDAHAGDTLAVRVDAIRLDRATGRTLLAPGHGLIPSWMLTDDPAGPTVPRHMYVWSIDPTAGVARLANPLGRPDDVQAPLRPFLGCIGVCPPNGQLISTLYAGSHGGNMDLPIFAPGAVALLPVFTDRAGLALGDVHAAQGHGEIVGGGIETSAEVTFSVRVQPGDGLAFVRAIDATRLYAVASDGDLRQAVQHANANLLRWLDRWLGLNRFDAYQLLSQCGELILGNCVTSPYTAAAALSLDALPKRAGARVRALREDWA